MNDMLAAEINVLKWRIATEQEKADRSRAGQNECRQKLVDLNQAFDEESKRAFQMTSEMKAQYKVMVKDLDEKIGNLERELNGGESDLFEKERNIKDMVRAKDKEIDEKDNEIRELRKKIDDMSQEFANMLKATLDKMQERIELANTQWDSDVAEMPLKRLD
eukprot:CAMPEP_0202945528 /NCGR_PEP_ID=MMETSP1395-20130829/6572_1 /ASSEMBLY_ACC=CAM_ASM_000871 /TAXON_ID=5961 /ORGANISM="Blepharisma japonicum, Strain Stock R1072" /LENGTH=161 /DNA_ID=CAMNT_0049645659 /DNA_START=131 /DNA_END=613 /DNA_ORIENTATION=+